MFRTLATAVLIAALSTAHAQAPLPQQQIPRPQPLPLPVPINPQLQTHLYTARTAANVRRTGAVTASGITWACQGTTCTVSGSWPAPGVGACAALAREVGRIVSYGRPGSALNAAQLAQCNVSLMSPPPPPPPPPPPRDPGTRITASELSVIGGAQGAAPSAGAIAVTTPPLSVVGGAQSEVVRSTGPVSITTPELSVIGQ